MKFYIYAGTNEQARNLAHAMNLARSEWTFINSTDALLGIYECPVLMYGTWQTRKDTGDLFTKAMERKLKILHIQGDI